MRHIILNADCFEFMATMENNSVDCTITDFPYNACSGYHEGGLRRVNRDAADRDTDGSDFDTVRATEEICRVTEHSALIFCGHLQMPVIYETMKRCGMKMIRIVVWEKTNPSPMNGQFGFLNSMEWAVWGKKPGGFWRGHHQTSVFRHPTEPVAWHPTAKPIGLLKQFIQLMCPEKGTVFDPCAGSLSLAVAANEMARGYICVEKNLEFVEKGVDFYHERLAQQSLF